MEQVPYWVHTKSGLICEPGCCRTTSDVCIRNDTCWYVKGKPSAMILITTSYKISHQGNDLLRDLCTPAVYVFLSLLACLSVLHITMLSTAWDRQDGDNGAEKVWKELVLLLIKALRRRLPELSWENRVNLSLQDSSGVLPNATRSWSNLFVPSSTDICGKICYIWRDFSWPKSSDFSWSLDRVINEIKLHSGAHLAHFDNFRGQPIIDIAVSKCQEIYLDLAMF